MECAQAACSTYALYIAVHAACYKASVVFGQTKRICTQARIVPFNYSPFYSSRNTLRNLFANWLDFLQAHADLMNKTSADVHGSHLHFEKKMHPLMECCLLSFCIKHTDVQFLMQFIPFRSVVYFFLAEQGFLINMRLDGKCANKQMRAANFSTRDQLWPIVNHAEIHKTRFIKHRLRCELESERVTQAINLFPPKSL
jgi:hypothetical protein